MIIILLGPPGAGKGTVANKINRYINVPIIATGDILRRAIESETDIGNRVKNYVVSGKLVPDNLIIEIVENRIKEYDCDEGFILDGFPRTINQASDLSIVLERIKKNIDQVFYFETSYNTIINRLSSRRICPKCNNIFNIKYDPPKKNDICDHCSTNLVQRADDQEDTIKQRLEIYNKDTLPLVSYYQERNILTKINADLDLKDRLVILFERLNELGIIKNINYGDFKD